MLSKIIYMETAGQIIRAKRESFYLLVQFILERIDYEISDEECESKVLKVAELKVKYLKSNLVKN